MSFCDAYINRCFSLQRVLEPNLSHTDASSLASWVHVRDFKGEHISVLPAVELIPHFLSSLILFIFRVFTDYKCFSHVKLLINWYYLEGYPWSAFSLFINLCFSEKNEKLFSL